MEIIGTGDDSEVNRVIWDERLVRLNGKALDGLLWRLERSTTEDEFLFRECEFDYAYWLAEDGAYSASHESDVSPVIVQLWHSVLTQIKLGHDLLGAMRAEAAAAALRNAINLLQNLEHTTAQPDSD